MSQWRTSGQWAMSHEQSHRAPSPHCPLFWLLPKTSPPCRPWKRAPRLPGCKVSLILRTGLELPLPSWQIWHPTGSAWDPGTSTVMSQGHPTLHPTQGQRTVMSDMQMTPPL